MENNNGRGIFYGVIGVATLVVAIIGATFAYFSAQVTASGNLTAGTANIKLGYAETITGLRSDIIPIDTDASGVKVDGELDGDTTDNTTAFAGVIGTTATAKDATTGKYTSGSCLDNNKNEICSTYQFTITNDSPSGTNVYGYVNQTAATTIEDLYYAMYVGTPGAFTNVWGNAGTAESYLTDNADLSGFTGFGMIQGATKVNDSNAGFKVGTADTDANWHRIDNATVYLEAGQSVTYTIVLWIEETYKNQEYKNMEFAGNIRFNTGTGSGVTGKLSV